MFKWLFKKKGCAKHMNNKLEVIGIDHGWSMMKTISQVFVTGVKEITTTPALFGDVLEYEGKFYKVGTVRQEVKDTKVEDDSFYLLTLAAVAKELKRRGLAEAKVFLAVGLPLTRFGAEKNDFIKYLTKNKRVSFKYENESYHIEIDDVAVFPQCYAAVVDKIPAMAKKTLIVDIGSWTIDIIYRSNGRSTARATSLAKVFVNNFNLPESTAIIDLAYGRCRDDNSHWQNVLKYCKDGCFQAMIDEYIHMLKETAGFQSDGNQYQIVHDMMMDSLKIHTATYIADTYPDFKKRINGADRKSDGCRIRSSYAVGFTKDAGDNSKVVMRKENIRNAFNSPMRPFVLATTSIGQEGLDFHNYCRVIMHWNLPSNPIDLEQREGRINRFKCLAIRQNVADKYGKADGITFKRDIWTEMFEAAKAEKQNDQSELVPFWCFGKNQSVKIERLVPMYPMSKDEVNYERLIKILSLYRLTLGQARQEELLEYLFKEFKDTSGLKKLFIDLSPFSKGKEG